MTKLNILYIEAWGNENEGYDWHSWYKVGKLAKSDFEDMSDDQDYADYFYSEGYTNTNDLSLVEVEDDQYNIVILEKVSGRPLFAIEYGNIYTTNMLEITTI